MHALHNLHNRKTVLVTKKLFAARWREGGGWGGGEFAAVPHVVLSRKSRVLLRKKTWTI